MRKTCVDHIHFSITVRLWFVVLWTKCSETWLLLNLQDSKKNIIVWSAWNQHCRGPKRSILFFFFFYGVKESSTSPAYHILAENTSCCSTAQITVVLWHCQRWQLADNSVLLFSKFYLVVSIYYTICPCVFEQNIFLPFLAITTHIR